MGPPRQRPVALASATLFRRWPTVCPGPNAVEHPFGGRPARGRERLKARCQTPFFAHRTADCRASFPDLDRLWRVTPATTADRHMYNARNHPPVIHLWYPARIGLQQRGQPHKPLVIQPKLPGHHCAASKSPNHINAGSDIHSTGPDPSRAPRSIHRTVACRRCRHGRVRSCVRGGASCQARCPLR